MYVCVQKCYIYLHTRADTYPVEVTTVLHRELRTLLASCTGLGGCGKAWRTYFCFLNIKRKRKACLMWVPLICSTSGSLSTDQSRCDGSFQVRRMTRLQISSSIATGVQDSTGTVPTSPTSLLRCYPPSLAPLRSHASRRHLHRPQTPPLSCSDP